MDPGFDLYRLSDEHEAIRAAVRAVCADKVAPHAAEVDETAQFPQASYDAARRRLPRAAHPREVRRGRRGCARDVHRHRRGSPSVRSVVADTSSQQAGHDAAAARRIGTAQRAISAGGRPRRGDVLLCAVRARSRFGPGLDVDSRRSQWRWLGPVRAEVMGHQRRCQRLLHGDGRDRSRRRAWARDHGLRRRVVWTTVLRLGNRTQAGHQGPPTRRAAVRRLRHPGDRAVGERGRPGDRAADARSHPRDDRRPAVGGIAAGALELATAYAKERQQFGTAIAQFQGAVHAGRHGDGPRGRPPAGLCCPPASGTSRRYPFSARPPSASRRYRDADHHRRRPAAGGYGTPATTRSSG